MLPRLLSLRHKLLTMVLAVNLCTLVAAGAALFYHGLMAKRAQSVAELSTLAGMLGQGSSAALEFDDPRVANESLAQLRADPHVEAAAIYSSKGELFARYAREGAPQAAIPAVPTAAGAQFDGADLVVFQPIANGRERLGTVYLKGRYDMAQWLREYLLILGAVLLASLAFGVLMASRLQRWILDPILAVAELARQVMERRDYRLRARKTTYDEVGQLAEAFNGMLQTLEHEIAERSAAEHAVRHLNAKLEQRVGERTAELQVANQSLLVRTEEAEAANRAKADFLANMSHEIRTPMNAVLGLAYLLGQRQLDGDAQELVRKIRGAGRSLQAIINDILDFSKIEAGRLELEQAPFRLEGLLDNLASIMGANAGDKDLELVIAPAPDVGGELQGDAMRLEQVLINLTGNAIKFTDHGLVKVAISLVARDDQSVRLRFAVCDTGIGIAPDKQTQIFAAFAQADSSTTRRFGGTGLGLAICRHLVTMMGGEIGVHSTLGCGSEFWFTVPFQWAPDKSYVPPDLAHLHVLVADDNEAARENLALTARSLGWMACLADSGEAALQRMGSKHAEQQGYDLLLLDWKMPPGIDGLATAAEIRRHGHGQALPIVLMVTAFSREDLLKQAEAGLVDGVLSKPVTSSTLYNCVAEALRRRGLGRAVLVGEQRLQRVPGVRVLVVDDSDINREVALRILETEGAIVSLAGHGREALDWLQAHPHEVDIVLMDVQMPVMDGYEATRQLRQSPLFKTLPVVALTAGAFKAQQDRARLSGMDAFVAKPLDVDALMDAIRGLVACRTVPAPVAMAPAMATGAPALELPGLALAEGLRIWREPAEYRKFLRKFALDYADAATRLRALHAERQTAAVRAFSHKLRGAAANLALTEVARTGKELELLASTDADPSRAVAALELALQEACASIERFADGSAAATAPASSGDAKLALPLLRELLEALDRDNPDGALPLLDALQRVMPAALLQPLRACIDGFDFRGAEQLVRGLSAALQGGRE